MKHFNIKDIENPDFMKDLTIPELEQLCADIRQFLIESISKTGGHFSSNLGAVELTVALHKVFNTPVDKIVWDVGHQAYIHKILTGRAKRFDTLRMFNGLGGFPDPKESVHDAFIAGHASTSISAAVGMIYARDLQRENYEVISVIGDGSLTGGLVYEALNHIGNVKKKLIVILNDNEMSISPNVGVISNMFTSFRRGNAYMATENKLRVILGKERALGKLLARTKANVKQWLFTESQQYEAMGFKYYGPIDGHNLEELIHTLEYAKKVEKPILIHVKTIKGKGFEIAEQDTDGSWHGVSPFNLDEIPTEPPVVNESSISWSRHMCLGLVELTHHDHRVAVITPAMIHGSALYDYLATYPERLIDVGIAESHAVTMAGGMAIEGLKPYVSIYSTFLQRSYDQIEHDVCLSNLNVVFGIDRAGITGADGKTHQGIFDIAMLRPFPNIVIMMPRNATEAYHMLYTAYTIEGPVAIRYPRGNVDRISLKYADWQFIPVGKWEVLKRGTDIAVISIGPVLDQLVKLAEQLKAETGIHAALYNARYIKPLDTAILDEIAQTGMPVLVYEEASLIAGLGSAVVEYYSDTLQDVTVCRMGIPDIPITHGAVDLVLESLNLSMDDVKEKMIEMVGKNEYGQ